MKDPKRVFLVHGRYKHARDAIVLFLRALKLEVLDFNEVRGKIGGAPFVGHVIRQGMDQCRCIMVLLTPEEYACLRPTLCSVNDRDHEKQRWQARPNVLIEAGMALALDEKATILVLLGNLDLPSDLSGRHYIKLDNSIKTRQALKSALVAAGCQLEETAEWHDTHLGGNFDFTLPEVSVRTPFC